KPEQAEGRGRGRRRPRRRVSVRLSGVSYWILALISLLKRDNWIEKRHSTHGLSLSKLVEGRFRAILGPKQTGLGREGLITLLKNKS
ncbi:MAG TPA: hypothetical protein PKN49_11235, partial [Candidatus Aminicenantes bacterium]|nr:hypothetical protein [Candidatus Aminicenantes bacterium]